MNAPAAFACCVFLVVAQASALEPTPRTGFGPFYPVDGRAPSDNDLTVVEGRAERPQGEILEVSGTVRDRAGRALSGATLVIWQTDVWGKYDHPKENRTDRGGRPISKDPNFQYWGKAVSDADGSYSFRTIVPGSYGRPRHIHLAVAHADYPTLATEIQFADDPAAAGDFVTDAGQREHLAVPLVPAANAPGEKRASFDIVLG